MFFSIYTGHDNEIKEEKHKNLLENVNILNTNEQNNLNFWKNMDDDLIGNKLFQDEKLENLYTYTDTDKQDKLIFDKNPNKKSYYSDLKTNYGNFNQ
jgi:hypothetical protein